MDGGRGEYRRVPMGAPAAEKTRRSSRPVGRDRRRLLTLALAAFVAFRVWWLFDYARNPTSDIRLHVDLGVYRMGGHALISGASLYDVLYPVSRLPFTYTPFAALLFVPLALIPWGYAYLLFSVVSIVALARTCWLLAGQVAPRLPIPVAPRDLTLALLGVGLAFEPVIYSVALGQVNLVIMWLVVEDLFGWGQLGLPRLRGRRAARAEGRPAPRWGGVTGGGRFVLSGVGIGLATGTKLIPAIFVVYLFLRGDRRTAGRAVGAAVVTVWAGFLAQPSSAWRYWTSVVFDSSRVGRLSYVGNQSLQGMVVRLTASEDHKLLWLVLALAVAGTGLWAALRFHAHDLPLSSFAMVALVSLLVSPVSWNHHWAWFVPFVAALLELGTARREAWWLLPPMVWLAWYGPIWWVAFYDHDAEFDHIGVDHIWDNAYVIGGLALFAGALAAVRALDRADAGPGAERAQAGGESNAAQRSRVGSTSSRPADGTRNTHSVTPIDAK